MTGRTFSEQVTPNGHLCGEASCALQKMIRRGKEREAMYWASELDVAGHGSMQTTKLYLHLAGTTFPDEAAALAERLLGSGATLHQPEPTSADFSAPKPSPHHDPVP